jgi:hypothetical protein
MARPDEKMKDKCNFSEQEIVLNPNRVRRNMVYVLSHELGHIEVRSEYSEDEEFLRRFPGYACAEHTKGNRVSQVEEEVFAWEKARKILAMFKIPIDELAFNKLKQACLSTYIA